MVLFDKAQRSSTEAMDHLAKRHGGGTSWRRVQCVEHIAELEALASRVHTFEDLAHNPLLVYLHDVRRDLIFPKSLTHPNRKPNGLDIKCESILIDPPEQVFGVDHTVERQEFLRGVSAL